jgi:hypothetical protein
LIIDKIEWPTPSEFSALPKAKRLKVLCDFILREQGRGFAMSYWRYNVSPNELINLDDIVRNAPACGAVACIGGSYFFLLQERRSVDSEFFGLTPDQAQGVFYGWLADTNDRLCWPASFRKAYTRAKTPLAKAKIAVKLLRAVVKNPSILEPNTK